MNTKTYLGLLRPDRNKDGVRAALLAKEQTGQARIVFAGSFDSAGRLTQKMTDGLCCGTAAGLVDADIVYYALELPDAAPAEMEKLLAVQVEALAPLPIEQLVWARRFGDAVDGQIPAQVAAARKTAVQWVAEQAVKNVSQTPDVRPKILPEAAGFIRGLRECFEDFDRRAAILRLEDDRCILAVAEGRRLCRAWAIDTSGDGGQSISARDAITCLESLEDRNRPAVYVVGRNKGDNSAVCRSFTDIGIEAKLLGPDREKLKVLGLKEEGIYDIIAPIGLAVAAADDDVEFDFNIAQKQTQKTGMISRKQLAAVAAALTAAMLVCTMAAGWFAQKELDVIRNALSRQYEGGSGDAALAQAALREAVAKQRPDIIEIFDAVSSNMPEGMFLDSFAFKKGQPVRITGRAGGFEQVYEFQKKLDGKNGISQVQLWEPRMEEKDKQVLFRITFNYRQFSGGVVQ